MNTAQLQLGSRLAVANYHFRHRDHFGCALSLRDRDATLRETGQVLIDPIKPSYLRLL